MPTRAFICGAAALALSAQERDFVRRSEPWGFILFRRNIGDPAQVAALVASFREIVGRVDAPVLIDQEGGRVQRLGPPQWRAYPSAETLSRSAPGGLAGKAAAVRLASRLMGSDLRPLGINVDCLPVLDVPAAGSHSVIGDRAYSADPAVVATLGRAAAEGLLEAGVLPVIKHIPGHGRAMADSHLELPVVTADLASLEKFDFAPFRALRDMPIAMTAHVVYTAIDTGYPATTSRKVIDRIIRGAIGFDGLLVSDDLSMKALSGSLGERPRASFAAGVDIVLHCNGDLGEAEQVAAATPVLAGRSEARAEAALARLGRTPEFFDPVDGWRQLQSLLAAAPVADQSPAA